MHNNKLTELTLQASRMVTGDVWTKLSALDFTEQLNVKTEWNEVESPEHKELLFHQLVVRMTEIILQRLGLYPSDNALRLCSMFVIQTLINQAKPELRMEMLGWLEKSKQFYKANDSAEAKQALLDKLENR